MKRILSILVSLLIVSAFSHPAYSQRGYEKSIELGTTIGVGEYSNTAFGISMINGYRFNNYFYGGVGVGIGYSNYISSIDISNGITAKFRSAAYLIPLYIDLKANLTTGQISPFINLNVGYTFDAGQYIKDAPGFMIEPAFGVDFKIDHKKSFYFLVGFNIQRVQYYFTKNVGSLQDWDISKKTEMFKSISLRAGFKF